MESAASTSDADQTLVADESQDSILMNQTDPLMITVIEKTNPSGGSDSGVEGCWNHEPLPTLTQSLHSNRGPESVGGYSSCATASCDSSLLSCFCDDTEELLTNTTVQRFGDCTSEGGSESSSIKGEIGSRRRSTTGPKRRPDASSTPRITSTTSGARSRPGRSLSVTPKPSTPLISSSKKAPASSLTKSTHSTTLKPIGKTHQIRTLSTTRIRITPSGITAATASSKAKEKDPAVSDHKSRTPSLSRNTARLDDGRWPSSVKPLPRKAASAVCSSASTPTTMEHKSSAIEKFATLPRRQTRRTKSPLSSSSNSNTTSTVVSQPRSVSVNRGSSRTNAKTRIFHEISVQTSLTIPDLESIVAGKLIRITELGDVVRTQDQLIQVDRRHEEVDKLLAQMKQLSEGRERLQTELAEMRKELEAEKAEKAAMKDELDRTAIRVLEIIGADGGGGVGCCEDSLQELESQMHSSSHIVTQQQKHISKLEALCRTFQRDLEKSLAAQKTLLQQQQELEAESLELKDFLQAEKATLHEALREAEQETDVQKALVVRDAAELERRGHECKHLVRVSEQRRQENLALQARLTALERRSRELLLQQGAALSGAALSLAGLGSRLDALVEQLVMSYDISEKDLEDVIFHNEAYSKSSSSAEASPERSRSRSNSNEANNTESANGSGPVYSSPKRGGSASFVSAVINAIRNATTIVSRPSTNPATPATPAPSAVATATPAGLTVDLDTDLSPKDDTDLTLDSELLECEAAPCLETDEAWTGLDNGLDLDDSTSPGSDLARSRSLQNLSQAIVQRQQAELLTQTSGGDCGCGELENGGEGGSSSEDLCTLSCRSMEDGSSLPPLHNCASAATLVDQVIDVDNLVTRLLKILRIIQLDNDQRLEEVQQERDILNEHIKTEESAKITAECLYRERETLVQNLRQELDDARAQLNARVHELGEAREAAEKYKREKNNLSREFELIETKLQEKTKEISHWQSTSNKPEDFENLLLMSEQVPCLHAQLQDKDKQLNEMGNKYLASQNMLQESWKQAANEVKRQYEVIDTALDTLQNVKELVNQCPPLAKMQEQLEECNFQSASSMPLVCADLNANAAVLTPNGTHNGLTLADNTSVVT